MPLYDGKEFAQEGLLQTAQHCAQAALHAPQLIGKTDIKMEVLSGKELEDYFRVQDAANKLGARFSGETYKAAYQMGQPPVLLLIGADVTPIVSAPCRAACPAGIDVPRYIRLIGDGQYDQAVAVIKERVPLAAICAYVCHAPCEAKCRRASLRDTPIAIEALKRFAVDHAAKTDSNAAPCTEKTGKRVAVLGSGPAGLTAAYYLSKVCGHSVTVFEALSAPGGMLRVGIPAYRLPREILDAEIAQIEALGVEIKLNAGQTDLDALFEQGFDAVFVATGAHQDAPLEVKGKDLPNVLECISFLRAVNLGETVKVGECVVVVGGGNAAMDAARTALRLGAKEVTILYRRTESDVPAHAYNVAQTLREGVKIEYESAVTQIRKDQQGIELTCVKTDCRFIDESDQGPQKVAGTEAGRCVDTLIVAAGQVPEIPAGFDLTLDDQNRIQVDPDTLATNRAGVFAAGDAVSGPSSVIAAIAAGRKGASWIDQYLGGTGIIDEVLAPPEVVPEKTPALEALAQAAAEPQRPAPRFLDTDKALAGFDKDEAGLTETEALLETTRCLKCDQVGFDCGGCGFKTCREAVINCQNRLNETGGEPWGWLMKGPSCIWRAMELGISVDWAAAAAHRLNVECRVGMIPATAFLRMGYMEGCTLLTVLPIGPCRERWYFSPGTGREDYRPAAMEQRGVMLQYPPLWMRFTGPGRDLGRRGINTKDRWWDPPYTRLDIVEDDAWGDAVLDRDYAIFAAADEIRKQRKRKRLNLPKIKSTLDSKKKGGGSDGAK